VVARTLTSIHAQAAHCTPADTARLGTVVVDLLTAPLAHHISTRYLHRLFESRLTTVAAFIRRKA
jgi:hypothetical protein